MATFSKRPLSASTNGKSVLVVATGTLGTLIHTSVSGTASFDEIWLYAQNTSSASSKLTVEYGGTAVADQIEITIPAESGLVLIVPGLFLNNSLEVRAFAGSANILSIHGYVNRVV
jgi:hypothetical protein